MLSRQCGCSPRMITMMLDVFEELSFITRDNGKIAFVDNPPKRELTASRHYQALENMAEIEQVMLDADTATDTMDDIPDEGRILDGSLCIYFRRRLFWILKIIFVSFLTFHNRESALRTLRHC